MLIKEEDHVTVGILPMYLNFSPMLSQFQPIFVSFVAISPVLCGCFKAMSLVGSTLTGSMSTNPAAFPYMSPGVDPGRAADIRDFKIHRFHVRGHT